MKECSTRQPHIRGQLWGEGWGVGETKRFRPNPFWFPYYPWVAYAKLVLMKHPISPLPDNLAEEILSFFEWRNDFHQQQSKKFGFLKPFCNPPLNITKDTIQNVDPQENVYPRCNGAPPSALINRIL